MSQLLYVAAGGAVGASARYLSVMAVTRWLGPLFPYGTLAVNTLGSLLIGIGAGLMIKVHMNQDMWMFLVVGILGGFTTYSSFSFEVVSLIERGEAVAAFGYVVASLILGVGCAYAGMTLTRMAVA
ncbi:MAG: fluoride efflux transporter CrcB [Rickettsiales bacterium]